MSSYICLKTLQIVQIFIQIIYRPSQKVTFQFQTLLKTKDITMTSRIDFSLQGNNKNKAKQLSEVQQEQCLHFDDWVTLEKGNQYILGHYKATDGISLEVIRKTKSTYKKIKPFGFFSIVPFEEQPKQKEVSFSSTFYLMHVQTGLYLSSVFDELHRHALFDHISLVPDKKQSCVFRFKKQIKENKGFEKPKKDKQSQVQIQILQKDLQFVKLNSSVRIFNVSSQKYIQLVKTQSNTNPQRQSSLSKSAFGLSSGLEKVAQTKQNQQLYPNIWLSQNFDYFTVRLQRRYKQYNPLLMSNYDTVMIYNKFSNTYIGVKKRRKLVQIVNYGKDQCKQDDTARKITNTINQTFLNSQKYDESSKNAQTQRSKIVINTNHLGEKYCLIEQTPGIQFENKKIFSFLWRVFCKPLGKTLSFKEKLHLIYPSLIKSKQIIYFQHLQSGLFMIKNPEQGQNSQPYILCENIDDELEDEDKDQCGRFLFRAQNLGLIRYQTQYIMNNSNIQAYHYNPSKLSSHSQPINISLPLTLDFEQQQFFLSKLPFIPRLYYFTYHFPQFLSLLVSFLNNPKAIDDRIYLLKQKITIMEMVYDSILVKGWNAFVEIDKGYYFLDYTVKLLRIVRLSMWQFQIQARNVRIRESEDAIKVNRSKANIQKNDNTKKTSHYQSEYYTFQNTLHPLQELFQLNATIFAVISSLLSKVLQFLTVVFSNESMQIFELIQQKKSDQGGKQTANRKIQVQEQLNLVSSSNAGGNSTNQAFSYKQRIKKKPSSMNSSGTSNGLNNSMIKKRLRNNSGSSSFKSSQSNYMLNSQQLQKSNFSHHQWIQKQQFSSQLLKQLIKSLVHLISHNPESCSEILKLLAIKQPYYIIDQLNEKLQKLEKQISQLNDSSSSKQYEGYENASTTLIGTTLKLHKHHETALLREIFHCVKLTNHVIEYFNDDLEYDWNTKLRYVEDNFQIVVNPLKSSKDATSFVEKDQRKSQLAISYNKKNFKLTDILAKTQNQNFKKLFKFITQVRSQKYQISRKKILKNNCRPIQTRHNVDEDQNQLQSHQSYGIYHKNVRSSQSSSSSVISSPSIWTTTKNRQKSHQQSKPDVLKNHKAITKKPFKLINQQKNYLFQSLKQVMKLKIINLKLKNLPLMQIFPFSYELTKPQKSNPFIMYKDISTLAFILQITNNLQVTLLNSMSYSAESVGCINISLLSSSRFLCCDFSMISVETDLFRVLNYGISSAEYCSLIKEDTIRFLIEESPFCILLFQESFKIFQSTLTKKKNSQTKFAVQFFIETINCLKIFFTTLEIFLSVGKWNFLMYKKIQKYSIRVCQLIIEYENLKDQLRKSKNTSNDGKKGTEQNQSHNCDKDHCHQQVDNTIKMNRSEQISFGLKDSMQSMIVQLNQLFEILYIQKKRIIHYPYINHSMQFFQSSYFERKYRSLIKSNQVLMKQIPILTQMMELNASLNENSSIFDNRTSQQKNQGLSEQYRRPFCGQKLLNSSYKGFQSQYSFSVLQQNYALLTWPYLSSQQIIIFYAKQLQLYQQTFLKTSSTIIKLNELSLLLNTLQSMQCQQKIKNNILIEIRQKIASISVNLRALVKLQGHKKIIKSFGLIQMVLSIVFNNTMLEKTSIKPFLQFLIEVRMWSISLRQIYRVLTKGGLVAGASVLNSSENTNMASMNFLLKNIKKQEFFVIIAKFLQQKSSKEERYFITQLICSNLLEILEYSESQPYQTFMQKMSFMCMIIEINPEPEFVRKALNKLLNRQDVQLYIEALRTSKNFEFFCQNVKHMKVLLQNKKLIQEKAYNQSFSSENLVQNRSVKNSSALSFGSNFTSNIKFKKIVSDFTSEKQEMTNQKRQQINKFVLLMTTIFRICKTDSKLVKEYFCLFVSFKEHLKIIKSSISSFGNSYELFKPLLMYLQCNQQLFSGITNAKNHTQAEYQEELFNYFHTINEVLSQYHLYGDELQSYQSTSTFFLPFVQQQDFANQEPHIQFNRQKIKKIASEIKNFSKKTYFWELILWAPCYQKQQGILAMIQRLIMSNLSLFQSKTNGKTRKNQRCMVDQLQKLQVMLNRILHSIFDNILSMDSFLDSFKGCRYVRLQTRVKKLKKIFIEIFPTIETSLTNLKSIKIKQQKQKMQDSNVIEQQQQDSLEFLSSDEKNIKSQHSYLDRQQSFDSMNRKNKNIRQTQRVPMIEMRITQIKKTIINKDKQKEQIYFADNVGYQIVDKLHSNNKLQKFIKFLQQNQNKRQNQSQEQFSRQVSMKQDLQSINLYDKEQMIQNLAQYLEQQSQDCVIDVQNPKGALDYKKNQQVKKRSSVGKFELKRKKSSSEINDIDSQVDASNYSHHAIIVAQNSLNQDMSSKKQPFNEQASVLSSSNVISKAKRNKKFLTKVAFESIRSLKNFKRADYSHFYERLKSYKFYEVVQLLKSVLFEYSLEKTKVNFQYQNELYYELEKLMLDFFSFNGTINSMFQNIQTYLKLQSQKAREKQFDYRTGYDIQSIDVLKKLEFKRYQATFIQSFQHQRDFIEQKIDTQTLFVLYQRQKLSLIIDLLENFIFQSETFQEKQYPFKQSTIQNLSSFHNRNVQQGLICQKTLSLSKYQTSKILQFLNLCLEKDESNQFINVIISCECMEGFDKNQLSDMKDSFENLLKNHQKITQGTYQFVLAKSRYHLIHSKRIVQNKHHKNTETVNHNSQCVKRYELNINKINSSIEKSLNKLKIICRILKIISKQNLESQQSSLRELIGQVQQSMKRYLFELIYYLNKIQTEILGSNHHLNFKNSSEKIQMLLYQIRIDLLSAFSDIAVFLNLSCEKSQTSENCNESLTINNYSIVQQLVSFSLSQSYEKIVRDFNLISNSGFQMSQVYKNQLIDLQYWSLKASDLQILKQYMKSISQLSEEKKFIDPTQISPLTQEITYQVIVGTLNCCLKNNLTLSNIEQLSLIQLLTTCLTFAQILLNSIHSIDIVKDPISNSIDLLFNVQIVNKKKNFQQMSYLPLVLKFIQFQVFLYNLLFKNQFNLFEKNSYLYYLKFMMNYYQPQDLQKPQNLKSNIINNESQINRFIDLIHVQMQLLNIFHHISFKIKSFPAFQSDLFEQRKIFISQSPKLQNQIQILKQMYNHLGKIFGYVIVSPFPIKDNKKHYEIATFPYFNQFNFVWKFSLMKLTQSFIRQKQRETIVFGAARVFLDQNSISHKIKHFIVKVTQTVKTLSQVIIIAVILIHLYLSGMIWFKIISEMLLLLNLGLFIIILIERMIASLIMSQITGQYKKLSYIQLTFAFSLMFIPFLTAFIANIYSFWNNKALPFLLFIFIFNRLQVFYAFFFQYMSTIKLIIIFLSVTFVNVLSFHLWQRFIDAQTYLNQNYLASNQPLFTIQGKPFNFLGMIFEFTKEQYITDPVVILFYAWLYVTQIFVVAMVSFSIMERLKRKKLVNQETGKTRQCYICSKKGEFLIQQNCRQQKSIQIISRDTQQIFEQLKIQSLSGLKQQKQQRIQQINTVLDLHIQKRHNIFTYINYFCYILNKKQQYLTEKQKIIRQRALQNDPEVYL